MGYPVRGQPLAPPLLRDLLGVPVPAELRGLIGGQERPFLLSDLDASIWASCTDRTCQALADAVVARVRRVLAGTTHPVLERTLSGASRSVKLTDIDLDRRTYSALVWSGYGKGEMRVGETKVGDLMKVRGFGAKGLVGLLIGVHAIEGSQIRKSPTLTDETRPTDLKSIIASASRLAKRPDAALIRQKDPRLAALLKPLGFAGDNLLEIATNISQRRFGSAKPVDVAVALAALESKITALSKLSLENELMGLLATVQSPRRAQMAARRLGMDGQGGCTLQACGDEFGVSRERIRQVVSGVKKSFASAPQPFAPILDEALELISSSLPAVAVDVETGLLDRGLTEARFRLAGLMEAVRVFKRSSAAGGGLGSALERVDKLAKQIYRVSRKSVEHWGVATTSDVAARVADENEPGLSEAFVQGALEGADGFQWLDEPGGWFWLRTIPRNRLVNQIQKVLAVAPTIHVAELRAGVGRHHRMQGVAPPRRVLLAVCRELPMCRVVGDQVIADDSAALRRLLPPNERTMVRVLTEHGPVMKRAALEDLCIRAGMNRSTFYVYLDYSPVIARYARGVYGLRGAPIPPGLVEDLKISYRRKGKVLIDFGWTPEGTVWIGYKLSEGAFASGVLSAPSALSEVLAGEYPMSARDGSPVGTLVVKGSSAWGFGPLFRRRGGEPGDYLLLEIDPSARRATAQLGEASLLSDYVTETANDTPRLVATKGIAAANPPATAASAPETRTGTRGPTQFGAAVLRDSYCPFVVQSRIDQWFQVVAAWKGKDEWSAFDEYLDRIGRTSNDVDTQKVVRRLRRDSRAFRLGQLEIL